MKGVILAGGLGTRMQPCTLVTNKHLLPVFNKPMVHYPIEAMVKMGITEIMVVTGGHFAGDFLKLLKNGKDFGLKNLDYAYQEGEGGIADALSLAEDYAGGDSICVILGDNIFEYSLKPAADKFRAQGKGARVLLKEVHDAERFGVAEISGNKITNIIEKPKNPPSKLAVTGAYFFDNQVFSFIKNIQPSARGELEITDVNNLYARSGQLEFDVVEGWWTDAGTFPSLLRASNFVAEGGANKDK